MTQSTFLLKLLITFGAVMLLEKVEQTAGWRGNPAGYDERAVETVLVKVIAKDCNVGTRELQSGASSSQCLFQDVVAA